MKSTLPRLVFACGLAAVVAGCTFPSSRRVVSRGSAGTLQRESIGTVTSVRQVTIEGQRTGIGMLGGGLMGSAVASGGRGVGGAVVQAGSTIAGAVVGQAVEEGATRKNGQEISIRLDDGSNVVVTQKVESGLFQDGDRVRVLNGGGEARVSMLIN